MNATTDHTTTNQHPSPDTLASFATYALSEDDQLTVQEHLADCDECAGSANIALRASGLLDRWNAQTHRAANIRGIVEASLELASEQPALAAFRARLTRWSE